jgi:hypothetical protein
MNYFYILPIAIAPLFSLSAQTVLMNFGSANVTGEPQTWNSFDNYSLGVLTTDLVDTSNSATGIQLEITNAFLGINGNGTTSASAPYPTAATGSSFYDANTNWNINGDQEAALAFSGLDVSKTYDFTLYASRTNAGDNRTAVYTLEGLNSDSGTYNPADNVTNTLTIAGIKPTATGIITLTITPDTTNTNSNKFIYLGVAELSIIPEPSTFALLAGITGLSYIMLRRRRV